MTAIYHWSTFCCFYFL